KTFILSVDGAIVTSENFANILLDVAVLRSLNIRVVLVHGASAQIKALAEERKLKPSDLDGAGITDAETLQLALTAANRLTHEILEGLSANDLRAACTNGIIAHPMGIIQGVDHLFTGKVERVDVELFQMLLNQGIIPIVPPLGFDGDGKTYRVNSDNVAVAVAEALKATKVLLIRTHEGIGTLIYANEYQQIRRAMKKDIRHILALTKNSVASDELIKRTRSALEKNLNDYYLFEIDKNPVACVALHLYPDQKKGELAFL